MTDQPWRRKGNDALAKKRRAEQREYDKAADEHAEKMRAFQLAAAERLARMSPYERLADAVVETFGDAVMAAVCSPEFEQQLRDRGYELVPITHGDVPEPPYRWVEEAFVVNESVYPLDAIVELWKQAFRAGRSAR